MTRICQDDREGIDRERLDGARWPRQVGQVPWTALIPSLSLRGIEFSCSAYLRIGDNQTEFGQIWKGRPSSLRSISLWDPMDGGADSASHPALRNLRTLLHSVHEAISNHQPHKPPILDSSIDVATSEGDEDGQWTQLEHIAGLKKLRDSVKIDLDVLDKVRPWFIRHAYSSPLHHLVVP